MVPGRVSAAAVLVLGSGRAAGVPRDERVDGLARAKAVAVRTGVSRERLPSRRAHPAADVTSRERRQSG